ncbi:tetratricopeptide repeat protein [Stenotrophomonas rhizophila]
MNTPDPEQRKLDIEEEKLRLARKGLRQDTFGKIVMPAVIVVLAAATYFGNTNMAERQHQLAIDVHKMQLRDKESQLGLRNEDAKAARNQRIQDFVRQEYQRITSDDPAVSQGAVAVAYAVFSDEPENTLVRAKISVLLADKQQRMAQQPTARQRADSELAVGQRQIVAGNFSLALRHLDTALTLDPSNPSSWNSKAYAQFRMKDGQGALSSISEAISLSPSDARLRRFVIINAAKILCSVGRTDDGLSYLNSGIAAIPNLAGEAREDKELTSTCNLISS